MGQGDFDPASIEVFVGVDMAKGDHYAQAITSGGTELFDRPVANDERAIGQLIADAAGHGKVALVVDQPASGAQLLLAVAHSDEPVAYVVKEPSWWTPTAHHEGPRVFRTQDPLGFLSEARELSVKEASNVHSRVQGRSGQGGGRFVSADRVGRAPAWSQRADFA